MSRSKLPQSVADWFAAVFTVTTVIVLVWLIAAAPQESRAVEFPAAGTPPARQGDERRQVVAPAASNYFPAHLVAPEGAANEPFARCS